MRYDYTALANMSPLTHPEDLSMLRGYEPHHPLARAHQGTVEADEMDWAPEEVFVRLNQDDRPNGREAPSLSVGDVVVLHTPDGDVAYACESLGFSRLDKTPEWENVDEYHDAIERITEDIYEGGDNGYIKEA